MIRFRCECGKLLQAGDERAGQTTRCPECGRLSEVPEVDEAADPAPRRAGRSQAAARRFEDDEDGETRTGREPRRTSAKAVTSLILGVASFVCSVFTAIPAIILALLSLRDIKRSRGRLGGQGLAVAGLITSGVGLVVMIPVGLILVGLLLPAVQKVREAATRLNSQNNLKQLAFALQAYHDANGCFPPAVVHDKRDGKPLYSWRVLLLPYLEQETLYKQFNLEEPWDSPHNKALLDRRPAVFAAPDRPTQTPGGTSYQGFVGNGAFFDEKKAIRMADIRDGAANTLMIVEAASDVPWTSPQDLRYNPRAPVLPLLCAPSDRGFNVSFVDGSVRYLLREVNDQTLHKAITRNGGEAFDPQRDLPQH